MLKRECDIIKLKCLSEKSKNLTELSDPTLTKLKEELVVCTKEESNKYVVYQWNVFKVAQSCLYINICT